MMDALNSGCFCASLDEERLANALAVAVGDAAIVGMVRERCPHAFSARPVFVSADRLEAMSLVVSAIETVVALPAWRALVIARSPAIAAHAQGRASGAFFGYDFHAAEGRLGLIEVNTNAGGAMLNAILARAHRACCTPVEQLGPSEANAQAFEQAIVDMFRSEWALAGRTGPLRTIAIVDEAPREQYLYPEFLLFQRLFERHEIKALIVDPNELAFADGVLRAGESAIDMVYNRLTDFYFEAPSSAALGEAWLADGAVITPHPQAHALYADKRNLVLLGDAPLLRELGAPRDAIETLAQGVPRTVLVDASNADELWASRKRWFFKPYAGFGGRAAYRGDKLTRKVWDGIVKGGYVAQALVIPGERALNAASAPLKFDLRQYVYQGEVQWNAARLYQGQTTNFRTEGGGFAPVYRAPRPAPQASCSDQSIFCQAEISSRSRYADCG